MNDFLTPVWCWLFKSVHISKHDIAEIWGQVMHICVSEIITIGSDNGLSPSRPQAIIWTDAGILLIGLLGIFFSESLIEIHIFSFNKMHLKMASAKWRLFGLNLNVLSWLCPSAILQGLTYWDPEQNEWKYADSIFKFLFSWQRICLFSFKFHWNLFLMVLSIWQ